MEHTPQPTAERGGYTVKEFAQRYDVVDMTIYREINSGRLKAIKVGLGNRRGLRITPHAETEWLRLAAYQPGSIAPDGGRPRKNAKPFIASTSGGQ